MYGVITPYIWSEKLCGVVTYIILLKNFLSFFLNNYQEELKIISGTEFNFQIVELMNYKLHKISLRRSGSYIKHSEWLVNKRATINPKNENNDEC